MLTNTFTFAEKEDTLYNEDPIEKRFFASNAWFPGGVAVDSNYIYVTDGGLTENAKIGMRVYDLNGDPNKRYYHGQWRQLSLPKENQGIGYRLAQDNDGNFYLSFW